MYVYVRARAQRRDISRRQLIKAVLRRTCAVRAYTRVAFVCVQTREKVTPMYATKDPEQMEQIYRQTLLAYKLQRDNVTERRERLVADVRGYEDEVRTTGDQSARMFDKLLDREMEVATDLVYAKTGRMLTDKAVNEITRRQV